MPKYQPNNSYHYALIAHSNLSAVGIDFSYFSASNLKCSENGMNYSTEGVI